MTLSTGGATGAPAPVGDKNWKYQGRLDVSPTGLAVPLYDMSARLYGSNSFRLIQSNRNEIRSPLEAACSANWICGSAQRITGGPIAAFNTVIDARDYYVGYIGAYLAFSQTYNPGFPAVEVFEPYWP